MIKAELMSLIEVKKLQALMMNQFGTMLEGFFYINNKNKVFLTTHFVKGFDYRLINAEGIGLYIGRLNKDGFRPSIEGIQLLRPVKNLLELTESQLWEWLRGFDLQVETTVEGYCGLTHNGEFIGPGKVHNGKLWNYVSKARRIKNLNK